MDKCTGSRDITEILLKTALNTNQSINHSIQSSNYLFVCLYVCLSVCLSLSSPCFCRVCNSHFGGHRPCINSTLINSFPNKQFYNFPNWKSSQTTISNYMKMAKTSPTGYKTLWEKDKLLVTSNFSFSHRVFKRLVCGHVKTRPCLGQGLPHQYFPHSTMNQIKFCECHS